MRTTTRCLPVLLLATALGSAAPLAHASGTTSGLAVAVTPDGSRLFAGGSNRALYELDPAGLAVKRRHWYGRPIMAMVASPDGKALVIESTEIIEWLRTDTFEPFTTLEQGVSMAPAPGVDLIAVAVRGFPPSIGIYGLSDGVRKAEVRQDPRAPVAAFGLSPDGKRLALLHARRKDEGEPKVARKDVPEDVSGQGGLALEAYLQQHDGYTSHFLVYDTATGEAVVDTKLWFGTAANEHLLSWSDDDVLITTYHNLNVRIGPDGSITPFQLGNGFNDARYATADGKALLTGGHRTGCRTATVDLASTSFSYDLLPGYPEHYKTFTSTTSGVVYAGTTAFRALRIGASGDALKAAPVY